jgi:hypothetical protein
MTESDDGPAEEHGFGRYFDASQAERAAVAHLLPVTLYYVRKKGVEAELRFRVWVPALPQRGQRFLVGGREYKVAEVLFDLAAPGDGDQPHRTADVCVLLKAVKRK